MAVDKVCVPQCMTHCVQCSTVGKPEHRTACQRSLVSLHFQLLLLQHYVALNFTAVTKALKKFEKKLGVALRNDYIAALVELPFYRCDALGELVEETERQFHALEQRASQRASTCSPPQPSEQHATQPPPQLLPPEQVQPQQGSMPPPGLPGSASSLASTMPTCNAPVTV